MAPESMGISPKINGKFGAKYRVTFGALDRPDGMIGKK